MMAEKTKKVLLAASCLTGSVVAWRYLHVLDGTEFAAGEVTGPLLVVHFMGSVLFVFALVLAFIRPRMAALGALAASLLCLPIYLYFVTPGFFRWMFPDDYSSAADSDFVWEGWAATGILAFLVIACLSGTWLARTGNRP